MLVLPADMADLQGSADMVRSPDVPTGEETMADDTTDTTETTQPDDQNTGAQPGQEQPDQEQGDKEVDYQAEVEKWKALSRKHEAAAKSNADKAKAFEEWQESQKTEQQRASEASERLQAERDQALAEAARVRAALEHGLSAEDLDLIGGGTPEEIEKKAKKLAARLNATQSRQQGAPDPRLGREQQPKGGSGDWLRDQLTK